MHNTIFNVHWTMVVVVVVVVVGTNHLWGYIIACVHKLCLKINSQPTTYCYMYQCTHFELLGRTLLSGKMPIVCSPLLVWEPVLSVVFSPVTLVLARPWPPPRDVCPTPQPGLSLVLPVPVWCVCVWCVVCQCVVCVWVCGVCVGVCVVCQCVG